MKRHNRRWRLQKALLSVLVVIAPPCTVGAEQSYSPYTGQDYPTEVYWGDTHVHTNLSSDAYLLGTQLGPEEAYRFAKGEVVIASNGMKVRLRRALDFLVVADHAENLGVLVGLEARDSTLLESEAAQRLLPRLVQLNDTREEDPAKTSAIIDKIMEDAFLEVGVGTAAFSHSVWERVTANADRHNDPGRFTAFSGYEWTSIGSAPSGGNLHRVVIFKDGADRTNQVVPFSQIDSKDPEDLWAYLAEYVKRTGGDVLAIPHNANLSTGEMFSLRTFAGERFDRGYAQTRRRWEPLYEVTQNKGDSESHPFLSPTDEFADFETWNSEAGKGLREGRYWNEEERNRKEGEYTRPALKRGLSLAGTLGINPFKFGLIGSTDAHTSLSAVSENNFWGPHSVLEPTVQRAVGVQDVFGAKRYDGWRAASGYAAVWATENTREAIFAAMRRKETYATTGPRMTLRFFGGWDYQPQDAVRPDLDLTGYRKGVPMGGDLTNAPEGQSPSFLIRAVKDPDGANLDRVQVIKGWRDEAGEVHERIYNVALSDGRKENKDGSVPPVGSTVDIDNATYTNTIGDPELGTVWRDPDFDSEELTFYYLRVLEIPTPRWTAYDAKFFNIKDIPAEVLMVTQERAYSSPIWYSPE